MAQVEEVNEDNQETNMSKGGFKDHNLMKVDPNKEQFAPTEAQPIRQRARMAGDPAGRIKPAKRASRRGY